MRQNTKKNNNAQKNTSGIKQRLDPEKPDKHSQTSNLSSHNKHQIPVPVPVPDPVETMRLALELLKREKVHFKDTQELIREFSDLEERNLFLVEKNQQNEESFFDLKKRFEDTRTEKSKKISDLTRRKAELRERLRKEEMALQAKLRRKSEECVGVEEEQVSKILQSAGDLMAQTGYRGGYRLEGKGAKESFVEYLTTIERNLFVFERSLGREYSEWVHKLKVATVLFESSTAQIYVCLIIIFKH